MARRGGLENRQAIPTLDREAPSTESPPLAPSPATAPGAVPRGRCAACYRGGWTAGRMARDAAAPLPERPGPREHLHNLADWRAGVEAGAAE